MNQEKIMEYQLLEQQFQQLNTNIQNIDQNIADIKAIMNTLDEFKKLKKGDTIQVPVANGIFAEATLDNSDKLKVNVGSNVIVDKSPEDAKKMMEEQIKDLEKYKEETMQYYEQMYMKLQALQQEMMQTQQEKS
ncbi:prefoldin subunit alpha [Candidatus Woesearchaeota archaeon]|nr:prefoldin subunit alpha [Candidatus Woesearchaeota archaeon]